MDLWASSLMDLRAPPPQVRLLPLRLHAQQAFKKSWSSRLTKTFCSSNRPLNRPDCAAEAPAKRGSRGASSADGAPWCSSRSESGGDRSPDRTPWRRVPVFSPDGLGGFQTRTIFSLPRRASSGYFSSDFTPSSPLGPRSLTTDRGTQTPSPSGRAVQLAQERMALGFGGRAGDRAQRRHGEHMRAAAVRLEEGRETLLVANHDCSLLPHPSLLIHPFCFHFVVKLSSLFLLHEMLSVGSPRPVFVLSNADLEQIMKKIC